MNYEIPSRSSYPERTWMPENSQSSESLSAIYGADAPYVAKKLEVWIWRNGGSVPYRIVKYNGQYLLVKLVTDQPNESAESQLQWQLSELSLDSRDDNNNNSTDDNNNNSRRL